MRRISVPVFILAGASLLGAGTAIPLASTQPAPDRTDWRTLLQPYGIQFSLRFTIELGQLDYGDGRKDFPPILLRFILTPAPDEIKTRDDFLDALRKWIPEANVTVDEGDKQMIHIRERSLDKRGPLALDEKVTLKFDGTVEDLWDKVAKATDGRLDEDGSGLSSEVPYDERVRIKFDLKDVTYRTLFTKFIPPNNSRILWSATYVKGDDKRPETILKLMAPTNDPPVTTTQP